MFNFWTKIVDVSSYVGSSCVNICKASAYSFSSCMQSWIDILLSLSPSQQVGLGVVTVGALATGLDSYLLALKKAKALKVLKAQHLANFDCSHPFKSYVWKLDSDKSVLYRYAKERVASLHDVNSPVFEDHLIKVCEELEPFGYHFNDFIIEMVVKGQDPAGGLSLDIVTAPHTVLNSHITFMLGRADRPSVRIPDFVSSLVERLPGQGPETMVHSPMPASWVNMENLFHCPVGVLQHYEPNVFPSILPTHYMWNMRMAADHLNLYFCDPNILSNFTDPEKTLYAWNRYYEAIQALF